MPTSTWGSPESSADEKYPIVWLRQFLKQMLLHFGAHGACLALYDEHISQMRILVHIRLPLTKLFSTLATDAMKAPRRRETLNLLQQDSQTPPLSPPRPHILDEVEDVQSNRTELFAVGTTYPPGRDLIGYIWQRNEAKVMRQEEYITLLHNNTLPPIRMDVPPISYLAVPICETSITDFDETSMQRRQRQVIGVIVLYHVTPDISAFTPQVPSALQYTERLALYLQNYQLERASRRTTDYLKQLQKISTVFPNSVKLSDLVENVCQFVSHVVDASSMLLTLYDRDLERLYDVLAINMGRRVEGLAEQPQVRLKEERPTWWRVTQHERRTLQFSPVGDPEEALKYQELLVGVWGDQRQAESFLLLPMKMYTRVIGALCLTSRQAHAYHPEEIQVLETMTQIVTVSIENAKLYERDRRILREATQRESQLAAINSALQAINSTLNISELLHNLVTKVADMLKVDICIFFQPDDDRKILVAQALIAPSSVNMIDDGSGMPEPISSGPEEHKDLISLIQAPFKDTFLEHMVDEGFFYLDSSRLEELIAESDAGGAIFLQELSTRHILIIPMSYQTEFIGFLAIPTPNDGRIFRPKEVGTILAICAQAASAVRNAQLFGSREDANSELEHMNKMKDEFLITASHELRTPLTAIRGYSSQLQRQSSRATPQQILRFATKISVAAQQLGDLLASMTEAAEISTGYKNLDLHIEPVQLRAAAEIAVSMLTLRSEQKVTLNIANDLWIRGDAARVRQVLTNLLENAAKYSPSESPIIVSAQVRLLLETETLLTSDQLDHGLIAEKGETSIVLVRVIDRGEGVFPADQERIFEKFVRAPRSLTTPVRGTGLGLYICRRFIEAMEGKIWLEKSIPNEGSTFTFYLPRVESPIPAEG